jgi:B12-binding domain/radical SAM domain protein
MITKYDVVLIHPPGVYDFRKRVIYGPLGLRVVTSVPIGLLSMADVLDKNGYEVKVLNLSYKMFMDYHLNVEKFIKNLESRIYGISLQWGLHSQGAIEVAKICKQFHPNSLVIMGGLTATHFADEIVEKIPWIDGVLRGEGEYSILHLAKIREHSQDLSKAPNLTYKNGNGKVRYNTMMKNCSTLDEFNFTRFDLLEPSLAESSKFTPKPFKNIPLCRGCLFNCISCGGSAYSYQTLFKREQIAFRSPEKIREDIEKLSEQRIHNVSLFQDMRMGCNKYQERMLTMLQKDITSFNINELVLELFTPASKDFLENISKIDAAKVRLELSPESGVESIRRTHGRSYSNQEVIKTAEHCRDLGLPLNLFFMNGLSQQTYESLSVTHQFWKKIINLNKEQRLIEPLFMTMVVLDPGSLGCNFPEQYGYKLHFSQFTDYCNWIDDNNWEHHINYSTQFLTRKDIVKLNYLSSSQLKALAVRA